MILEPPTIISSSVTLESIPAQRVKQALLCELNLTPKPGLVDRDNSGSHRDMDYSLFLLSIEAITPFFDEFYFAGKQYAHIPISEFLSQVRPIGIACEKAMFTTTQGINTHKGGIFAFGLFCSVIGRLEQQQQIINVTTICHEVAAMCDGLVDKELSQAQQINTVGESLFKQYGLAGARGEAASGYATVTNIALPVYLAMKAKGNNENLALLETLLYLFAYNSDTNVVSRGGMSGLQFLQHNAKALIQQGGMQVSLNQEKWEILDKVMIERNLSPGGSADLLAITWFLAHYSE